MTGRITLLRAMFLVNAFAALSAAIVLVVSPNAIPGVAGLHLDPDEFLLCYLLAGAEAAIAMLCIYAFCSRCEEVTRVAAMTLIVLHASTSALAAFAILQGASTGIWWNIVARVLIVIAIILGLRALSAASNSEH
jgi:hypothetical protein